MMNAPNSSSNEKKFEQRYSAGLLLVVALLLMASIHYTLVLWPLKLLLASALVLASTLLIRRANHL